MRERERERQGVVSASGRSHRTYILMASSLSLNSLPQRKADWGDSIRLILEKRKDRRFPSEWAEWIPFISTEWWLVTVTPWMTGMRAMAETRLRTSHLSIKTSHFRQGWREIHMMSWSLQDQTCPALSETRQTGLFKMKIRPGALFEQSTLSQWKHVNKKK